MKISLDFDGVLAQLAWQTVAASFQDDHQVYIVTARCPEQGARVYEIADQLEIPREQVLFTCNRDKWEAIQANAIELHVDNNAEQLALIEEFTDAVTVNANDVPPYELIREDLEDYDDDDNGLSLD